MSKGYVYIMTSAIDGLIKIGKSKDWNRRCQSELESNGYKNANGLKTYFVVEVEDQEEIESIMHDIFRESRVSNFELFAVDKDRAKRVLSKMGKQVYPAIDITTSNSTKTIKTTKTTIDTNNIYIQYSNFYNIVNKFIKQKDPSINTKSITRHYYPFPVGKSGFFGQLEILRSTNQIRLYIGCLNEDQYNILLKNKVAIEKDLGYSLNWDKFIGSKSKKYQYKIGIYEDLELDNYNNTIVENIVDKFLTLRKTFMKYI